MFETSPLRQVSFRHLYIGSVAVALGYTMQATVAAWLMATLTPSALMVALVQTASTAPSLLFGLLAGSLADIFDRRRIILATQLILLVATATLGVAALLGMLGPVSLLAGTFLIGAGFTLYLPAQQASINDLVGRAELPRALGLGAVAFNLARAAGPRARRRAGSLVGLGQRPACQCVVLRGDDRRLAQLAQPAACDSRRAGNTAVRHPERAALCPALAADARADTSQSELCVCASALWALLPVIARDQLGLGAGGFGLLSASFGIGAVIGALYIPRQLHRVSLNTVVSAGVILWVIAALLIALTHTTAIALLGACAAGAAWVAVLASLAAGTQSTAPAWVRARAVAMSLVAMQASLALGSVLWGWLASSKARALRWPFRPAPCSHCALGYRMQVRMGDEADITPGLQLPELAIAVEPHPDDGPVLIQVEYQIDAENREAF